MIILHTYEHQFYLVQFKTMIGIWRWNDYVSKIPDFNVKKLYASCDPIRFKVHSIEDCHGHVMVNLKAYLDEQYRILKDVSRKMYLTPMGEFGEITHFTFTQLL